jgi:ADP-glucose pyrophosphorylase
MLENGKKALKKYYMYSKFVDNLFAMVSKFYEIALAFLKENHNFSSIYNNVKSLCSVKQEIPQRYCKGGAF